MDIHIPNQEAFDQKLSALKQAGINSLHIVSDWDRTMTKGYSHGKKVHSAYARIRERNYLGDEYTKKEFELFQKYYPIEHDHSLSNEEKSKHMVDWWKTHWDLMVEAKFNRSMIQKLIDDKEIEQREGMFEFFDILAQNNVPILILSSGIGNVIKMFLEHHKRLTKNIHIISNFFTFNEEGVATGYSEPLIHSYNKNESGIKDHPYQKEIEEKKSVILIGDSLGDLKMTEGINHDTILKIGFLNDADDDLLEKYSKQYDILILNDGTMEKVIELVKEITS